MRVGLTLTNQLMQINILLDLKEVGKACENACHPVLIKSLTN
jgi:hypothetical protein